MCNLCTSPSELITQHSGSYPGHMGRSKALCTVWSGYEAIQHSCSHYKDVHTTHTVTIYVQFHYTIYSQNIHYLSVPGPGITYIYLCNFVQTAQSREMFIKISYYPQHADQVSKVVGGCEASQLAYICVRQKKEEHIS